MQALFEGKKELFKGLWIEQSDWQWEKHPVIHITFDKIDRMTPDRLEKNLQEALYLISAEYGIVLPENLTSSTLLVYLVSELSKINKVVLIIDEYDKAILDHITNLDYARQMRDLSSNSEYIFSC